MEAISTFHAIQPSVNKWQKGKPEAEMYIGPQDRTVDAFRQLQDAVVSVPVVQRCLQSANERVALQLNEFQQKLRNSAITPTFFHRFAQAQTRTDLLGIAEKRYWTRL